jgi:hypothetical protein
MANYRRDPLYLIDNPSVSLSFVFYEGQPDLIFNRYSWGIRRLSWPVADRWSLYTPWWSFFIELWFLRRILK